MQRLLLLLLTCLCATPIWAASLSATLDRADIAEGESLTLTVEAVDVEGDLDFSVLDADFEVLNVSRSRNVRIINGRSDSSLTFEVALLPKRTGELTIPVFSLGGVQSQALTLIVGEAAPQVAGVAAGREFFVEVSADNTTPYVQQQVILTVKVFQTREIVEGRLDDPPAEALVVQRLGKDVSYQSQLQGRPYSVIERRFAVFPQQSGAIRIDPIALTATVRRTDRWRGGSFFAPTENIRVASNALQLDVKPRPVGVDGKWWLPAEALNLTENWSGDAAEAKVGEPLTRTLNLSALGVQENQLPVLKPPTVDGLKIYPDQPELQTVTDGEGLQSYRTDKWAIIPQRAGQVTLPEVRVSWFDTESGQAREATLPAQTLTVLPGTVPNDVSTAGLPEATEAAPETPIEPKAPQSELSQAPLAEAGDNGAWRWIALLALSGWVATALLWWRSTLGRTPPQAQSSTSTVEQQIDLRALRAAAAAGDAPAFRRALANWAQQRQENSAEAGLKSLAKSLNSDSLGVELKALDAAVYGHAGTIDLQALLRLLEEVLARKSQPGNANEPAEAGLPQL